VTPAGCSMPSAAHENQRPRTGSVSGLWFSDYSTASPPTFPGGFAVPRRPPRSAGQGRRLARVSWSSWRIRRAVKGEKAHGKAAASCGRCAALDGSPRQLTMDDARKTPGKSAHERGIRGGLLAALDGAASLIVSAGRLPHCDVHRSRDGGLAVAKRASVGVTAQERGRQEGRCGDLFPSAGIKQ
jgi:hypothetical protein